jgi:uncharacterized integral membrane protein
MVDDAAGWTELDEPGGRSRERRGTGISRWSFLVLGLVVLLVVVLGQNTERVEVHVLWADLHPPLFVVVLLAGLVLTLVWELTTLALRHRRRRESSLGWRHAQR